MIWWYRLALLVVFAVLLWAFTVFLWGPLKEQTRGWLRVMLMIVLAPACALTTLVVSAVAGMALSMAFESNEAPGDLSEPPARTEPAEPETTSEETTLPDDHQPEGGPVFLGLFLSHVIALGRAVSLGLTFTLVRV